MFNFLRYGFFSLIWFVLVSGLLVASYLYNAKQYGSGFNYSVDFTGGTQVLFKFSNPVSANKVQEILKNNGWPTVITREFSEKEVLVRVGEVVSDSKGLSERLRLKLSEKLQGSSVEVLMTDSIGAGIGSTLREKSVKAIILALLLMLLYIGLFFKFAFAIGAIVALFHDVVVILAFFSLFYIEISPNVISAILAVLGYSINDTIVIFSRIRENLKRMKNSSLIEVINTSINQTLRRTLLTSLSTALVVGALLVFGGEILRTLASALLLGIVFGTYSSIFIASPIMLFFYKKNKS